MPFDATPIVTEPVVTDDELLSVLIGARQRLLDFGWTQERFYRDGKFCMMGAVLAAFGYSNDEILTPSRTMIRRIKPTSHALRAARPWWSYWTPDNTRWNDRSWRREQTVLRVFDRAIARRRRQMMRR
jgi:hypothetical protein